MTRDDILLIAKRMIEERGGSQIDDEAELLRFAVVLGNRVAAVEREACAKVCADYTAWGREWGQDNNHMAAEAATNECAAAIRARGKKK